MPQIPKKVNLTQNSADIINAIRNETELKHLPEVSADDTATIRTFGQSILSSQVNSNVFLDALVNRIGKVVITSKLYENPWAMLKKGFLEFGETVEEIFVSIAKPHSYDPLKAESELYKREKPDVKTAFHMLNFQKFYKATVQEEDLRQAFLSWSGITDLIGRIIDQLVTASNLDELLVMKHIVATKFLDNKIKRVDFGGINKTSASDLVTTIKEYSNNLTYLDNSYNEEKVLTKSDKKDQYLIMNSKVDANVDVNVLAVSFNMEKAEFAGHRTPINSFSFNDFELERLKELLGAETVTYTKEQLEKLKGIHVVLMDRDWFMVFDNMNKMNQVYNEQGLYWNHFYHVWKIFSSSPFANAVAFAIPEPIEM